LIQNPILYHFPPRSGNKFEFTIHLAYLIQYDIRRT
jgi:hypothetical protein